MRPRPVIHGFRRLSEQLRNGSRRTDVKPIQSSVSSSCLRNAIASGKAHVAGPDGGPPDEPRVWGWRVHSTTINRPRRAKWRLRGLRVGWLDGDDLYLDVDAANRVAQVMAAGCYGITVDVHTLVKRLNQAGWLKTTDPRRHRLKVRRVIEGARREVLHLEAHSLRPSPLEKAAQAALLPTMVKIESPRPWARLHA